MIKTILVPATGKATDAETFAAALEVARPIAAHIDALHVRFDPVEMAVAAAAGDGSGGVLLGGLIDQLEQDVRARESTAHTFFTEFCAREKLPIVVTPAANREPSAEWHVETGQEARWMANYGMAADLILAPRASSGNDAVPLSTLEAMLLETGRPLFIPSAAPPASGTLERIAIGWKPTPQAARAVAFAMPFIERANEVVVLTVEEEEGRRDDAARLVNYFAWHGVKATAERLAPGPGGPAETLLAAVGASAGLLVMGGYGHTRLREWVFGGFTQRVLAEAPLAVLMAH